MKPPVLYHGDGSVCDGTCNAQRVTHFGAPLTPIEQAFHADKRVLRGLLTRSPSSPPSRVRVASLPGDKR